MRRKEVGANSYFDIWTPELLRVTKLTGKQCGAVLTNRIQCFSEVVAGLGELEEGLKPVSWRGQGGEAGTPTPGSGTRQPEQQPPARQNRQKLDF